MKSGDSLRKLHTAILQVSFRYLLAARQAGLLGGVD